MVLHQWMSLLGARFCWFRADGDRKVSVAVAIALSLTLASCGTGQNPTSVSLEPGPSESGLSGSIPSEPSPSEPASSEPIPSEPSQPSNEGATSQVIGEPIVPDHALIPGRHCYFLESDTLMAAISLSVAEDDQVTGESQGTIANKAASYYSSYVQTFNGSIEKEQLALDLTTYIEEDQQQEQVSWRLANDQLNTGREVYDQVDCSVVERQLKDVRQTVSVMSSPYERETEGLADGALSDASAPRNELTEGAEFVRVRRLAFMPGLSSSIVEDSVVRAHRDEYLVGAAAGQTMTLSISALEQNAVLGLVAPDGSVLFTEETAVELALPQSGDYSIVVGGTRGNASYDLAVEIR